MRTARARTIRPRPVALVAMLVALVGGVLAGPGLAAALAQSAPEWNIDRIGAPRGAPGMTIAVVDTGVDPDHPALAGRVLPEIDVVGDGRDGDPEGHGTHVAGTAAGSDNGCGTIGVAPDARILPVRVLNADGEGTIADVDEGIRRAADAGAAVINLSLGSDVVIRNVTGSGLEDAIEYAWSKGSVPVLAAGNDGLFGGVLGSGYGDLPAIVVTATTNQDRVASYATSVGSAMWGLAAPGGDLSGERGGDILSSYPGDRCALLAGTSMAAPHVSGALAVLRARGLSPQAAVERLLDTARDVGSASTYGAGLLDLGAAVAPASTPSTRPAPTTTQPTNPPTTAGGQGGATSSPPTTSPGPTTAPPTPATGVAPSTTADADGTTTTGPSTTVDDVGSGDPDQTRSAPTTSGSDGSDDDGSGQTAGDLTVNDEDTGAPVALVLVAAGAVAVAAAGGVTFLRRR